MMINAQKSSYFYRFISKWGNVKINLSKGINFTQTDFQNTQTILIQASGREHPLASCFRKGCCLHLVMFIKMAAVSYLNANYCYDTQDNLTCFSNLFFLVIRCSNWKIFQSVTTVLKVKWWWLGAGGRVEAFPLALNYKSGAGCWAGGHLDEPCQGPEIVLLKPNRWHPWPFRVGWFKRKVEPQ